MARPGPLPGRNPAWEFGGWQSRARDHPASHAFWASELPGEQGSGCNVFWWNLETASAAKPENTHLESVRW